MYGSPFESVAEFEFALQVMSYPASNEQGEGEGGFQIWYNAMLEIALQWFWKCACEIMKLPCRAELITLQSVAIDRICHNCHNCHNCHTSLVIPTHGRIRRGVRGVSWHCYYGNWLGHSPVLWTSMSAVTALKQQSWFSELLQTLL
jgi:hypothetical protein